jgi:SRSO17 transposase
VQRQYSGTLGRIDNCQIGTFLAYASTAGDRVLVDRELYLPQESWLADPARCAEAGIPEETEFATRPAQVQAMIGRMLKAGLPFAWFTADEEFGQNPGLRQYLEGQRIAYVMAVPKNTRFTGAAGREVIVDQLPRGWRRTPGSGGPAGSGPRGSGSMTGRWSRRRTRITST